MQHEFDLWHIVKGVKKKLLAGKDKDLVPWVRAVANHLWYCAATCEGNADLLREKWLSMLHHITNEHQWVAGEYLTRCEHRRYQKDKAETTPWICKDSKAFGVLQHVVLDKRLLRDLEKV